MLLFAIESLLTNYTYYFFTPVSLTHKQDYSVLLNGKWLTNNNHLRKRQIGRLTDQQAKKLLLNLDLRTNQIDMILTRGVYRAEC